MSYSIREASAEEVVNTHFALAVTEGWNPGPYDMKNFLAIDPSGFLVGIFDGEIVACISAIQTSPSSGHIGLYLCKKEHRGKGYALPLFQAALKKLSHVGCIGIDGVLVQVPNYLKSGFTPYFESARHLFVKREQMLLTADERTHLVNAKENEDRRKDLLSLQQSIHHVSFDSYYCSLFQEEDVKAFSYYSEAGIIQGFAALRPALIDWRIGPLYAQDCSMAVTLFKALIEHLPLESKFFGEIPDNNPVAMDFVKALDMTRLSVCARMYTQEPAPSDSTKIFMMQSWALGP